MGGAGKGGKQEILQKVLVILKDKTTPNFLREEFQEFKKGGKPTREKGKNTDKNRGINN